MGLSPDVSAAVADAHRRDWAYVLAATVRVARDLDLAEECVQEAYVAALTEWGGSGVPLNPPAWLTTVARRKALDALRRADTARRKLPLLVDPASDAAPEEDEPVIPDDRLRLIFTCCHPALSLDAQLALTLRLVCGLTTEEVAAAFLVPTPTMAARITRAKKKISVARIPYRVPTGAELPDRLDAVLSVVEVLYATGHTAPVGDSLVRPDLVERALQLARTLLVLLPDEREVRALLALLMLTDARRGTRVGADGGLVLLDAQDRRRWDRQAIGEGLSLVRESLAPRPGRFALQAAIAAVHAEAESLDATDWRQILGLYTALLHVRPSPVVALNRAVALAEVAGPEVALEEVRRLAADARLRDYRYLPATEADLLRRTGRRDEAAAAYRRALALAGNEVERAFLTRRLGEVQPGR